MDTPTNQNPTPVGGNGGQKLPDQVVKASDRYGSTLSEARKEVKPFAKVAKENAETSTAEKAAEKAANDLVNDGTTEGANTPATESAKPDQEKAYEPNLEPTEVKDKDEKAEPAVNESSESTEKVDTPEADKKDESSEEKSDEDKQYEITGEEEVAVEAKEGDEVVNIDQLKENNVKFPMKVNGKIEHLTWNEIQRGYNSTSANYKERHDLNKDRTEFDVEVRETRERTKKQEEKFGDLTLAMHKVLNPKMEVALKDLQGYTDILTGINQRISAARSNGNKAEASRLQIERKQAKANYDSVYNWISKAQSTIDEATAHNRELEIQSRVKRKDQVLNKHPELKDPKQWAKMESYLKNAVGERHHKGAESVMLFEYLIPVFKQAMAFSEGESIVTKKETNPATVTLETTKGSGGNANVATNDDDRYKQLIDILNSGKATRAEAMEYQKLHVKQRYVKRRSL